MEKNSFKPYLIIGILFALFNIIAFVIPIEKTVTFWVAYIFSVIAFAAQFVLWWTALGKKETIKSKFLGISIIQIGATYLAIQLIAFTVFAALPEAPTWIVVIVCSVIIAVFAVCSISGQAGINEIERIDDKVKVKRAFIQFLQADIEMIADSEADSETKEQLKKLAEKVRFSDPKSHEMLGDIESRISAKVEEMKKAADKKALIPEIELLLSERNKKCKILK